jgi:iron complex transport system permease protein
VSSSVDGSVRTAGSTPLHIGAGRVWLVVRRRGLLLALVLLGLLAVAAVVTMTVGDLGIPLARLVPALFGDIDAQGAFVLERLRGPRLAVAIGTGLALGAAGTLFQSVARNPLGSPDVIGVGAGAGAGAAVVALLIPGLLPVPVGAVLGGGLAVLVVYLVTGSGFARPGKLVVAGVGVAAMATAFTNYVVSVVARDQASVLAAYINGTLSARSWEHAATIWGALLLVLPCALLLSPRLLLSEMGDDVSAGLGARPRSARASAVVLSVLLAGAAVSVTGPIVFVALTAPNIARRLSRAPGPNLVNSALTGALLLVLADLAAQYSGIGDRLPVGVFTLAFGGGYLGYLLVREWRRGTF